MKYVVHTEIDKRNHIIKQSVNCVGDASILNQATSQTFRQHVSTQVFRLQESQLREALIRMGWTPPPETEEDKENAK